MPDDQVMPDSFDIGGGTLKVPVYSDIAGAVNAWGDGKLNIGDAMAGADAALGILGAALDPASALLGAAIDYLMNLIVSHIQPLKEALDKLLGSPDDVAKTANGWVQAAQQIGAAGQRHAAYASDTPSWTGPAAQTYHGVLEGQLGLYSAGQEAAASVASWINVAGVIVGLFRKTIWDSVKSFLVQVVEAAIAALASSWCTFGGSIAAFTAWFTARTSAMCARVSSNIAKLLRKCAALSRRLHMSGQHFDDAANRMSHLAVRLSRSARSNYGRAHSIGGLHADPSRNMRWNHAEDFWRNHPGLERTKDNYERYHSYLDAEREREETHQEAHEQPSGS